MKTSVYLPDALAEQVKAHGISISEVTQEALRQAVQKAELKEKFMSDIHAVAERLRATIDADLTAARAKGHEHGVKWAKEYATFGELLKISLRVESESDEEEVWPSVETFLADMRSGDKTFSMPRPDDDSPYWQGFFDGCAEVFLAVQDLL
ncbi:type II toxin-antitoxin system CcdA family antitoxin [Sphaerisporangium sp. NPDC051017]|uniref:type II toxin-antitoxin system CcdA family antitoxin n=1 Tax=Sphaerisporangium sp. NPDC051017 TaxID=3154636 RepID=UPI0034142F87